jgi:hypothetical protein
MSYLIYIPGARGAGPAEFAALGLEDLVKDGMPTVIGPQAGPDGGQGCICTFGDPLMMPAIQYLEDRQKWRPARPTKGLAAGRYWLGAFNDGACQADPLVRGRLFKGRIVRLSDGQEWLVPIAQSLPHIHGLNEQGDFERRPCKEYVDVCGRAISLYEDLVVGEDGSGKLTIGDGFEFAAMILAVQYRVNADIVDFLDLLDDDAMGRVIGAALEIELTAGPKPAKAV